MLGTEPIEQKPGFFFGVIEPVDHLQQSGESRKAGEIRLGHDHQGIGEIPFHQGEVGDLLLGIDYNEIVIRAECGENLADIASGNQFGLLGEIGGI